GPDGDVIGLFGEILEFRVLRRCIRSSQDIGDRIDHSGKGVYAGLSIRPLDVFRPLREYGRDRRAMGLGGGNDFVCYIQLILDLFAQLGHARDAKPAYTPGASSAIREQAFYSI